MNTFVCIICLTIFVIAWFCRKEDVCLWNDVITGIRALFDYLWITICLAVLLGLVGGVLQSLWGIVLPSLLIDVIMITSYILAFCLMCKRLEKLQKASICNGTYFKFNKEYNYGNFDNMDDIEFCKISDKVWRTLK